MSELQAACLLAQLERINEITLREHPSGTLTIMPSKT